MKNTEFSSWFTCIQQQALINNERRLIALVGDSEWSSSLLKSIDKSKGNHSKNEENTWLVYGENSSIESNVAKQRFSDKLGSESNIVVFQDTDLSIDALAGLSGTLVGGGIFFLLVTDENQISSSPFYQRFFSLLTLFSEHTVIKQTQFNLPSIVYSNEQGVISKPNEALSFNCVTPEQMSAVEAVMKVFKGKRNRPLILTADRGRGKSSALAIACGEILGKATQALQLNIVITAVDMNSLNVFFAQLARSFPSGELQKTRFITKYATVEYVAIDQLIKRESSANLVLVDEAAAIPIYLLEQLLNKHARIVFSSTIHGYEGAGRGFSIKFQGALAKKYPKYRGLHIHEPIRWRKNDSLERLIFDTCLLNAELTEISVDANKCDPSTFLFKQFKPRELVKNEGLLKQVFSILVTAHYQTKPSDVRMLLDNEHVQLVCLLYKCKEEYQVASVALLMSEGRSKSSSISDEEVNAMSESKRRLKNHFVPQSLLTQCGIDSAFDYHYLRVMRIAVHPQLQKQGVGSYFINKISEFSAIQGADFLASSFGANQSLLSFWLKNDFGLARIGFKKDKASGEQSALVLKGLTQNSVTALADINSEFYRSFDYLLTDEYKLLNVELVFLILQYCPSINCAMLSKRDKANIEAFAQGYSQYSNCVFSLHLWLKLYCASSESTDDAGIHILISRIMQKMPINDVCHTYGFTGKKELETFLKSKVKTLLSI